jgi:hypothetical protein
MSDDPQGYGKLHALLNDVEVELVALKREDLASLVRHARAFSISSASEFLGESLMAFDTICESAPGLSDAMLGRISRAVEDIKQGFRAVGDAID